MHMHIVVYEIFFTTATTWYQPAKQNKSHNQLQESKLHEYEKLKNVARFAPATAQRHASSLI